MSHSIRRHRLFPLIHIFAAFRCRLGQAPTVGAHTSATLPSALSCRCGTVLEPAARVVCRVMSSSFARWPRRLDLASSSPPRIQMNLALAISTCPRSAPRRLVGASWGLPRRTRPAPTDPGTARRFSAPAVHSRWAAWSCGRWLSRKPASSVGGLSMGVPASSPACGPRPLHLGHLTGALDNWVRLRTRTSATSAWYGTRSPRLREAGGHRENILEVAHRGVSRARPSRSSCHQSHVPEHAELHLLLSMLTPAGLARRCRATRNQQQQLSDRDLRRTASRVPRCRAPTSSSTGRRGAGG